jgi:hypothetical protein
MHGTFEDLRAAHPGKWLLIRTDGREAETGTLLFVHEDPKVVGRALVNESRADHDKERSLYTTWSIPDDDDLPAFIL